MAKKDEIQGVQCENADLEIMRRQLARLEKMFTDKFTEVNDRIENIQVPAPAFPTPAEPQQPQPIEVSLPDNIATRDDIRALSGMVQTLNGTVSLVMKSLAEMQKAFSAMPRPNVDAIVHKAAEKTAGETARKVVEELTPKIDDSTPKDEEIERISLPHQRERRLTPGEIQAIKDMRASPNIPEDAKPELPEGYE
ncbi:unknown [Bacteroides sp. CAG:927]|nr:unknown [Bacteroides sp. CAG:927]